MIGTVSKCVNARPEFRASCKARGILLRRLAPDAPGLRMQPAGLRKMVRSLVALAPSEQILGEPEMRVRLGNGRIWQVEPRADGCTVVDELARWSLQHPIAHRPHINLFGALAFRHLLGRHLLLHSIHLAEGVGRTRILRRSHDPPRLVNPGCLGHIDRMVKVANVMVAIDPTWVRWFGRLDPRGRGLRY